MKTSSTDLNSHEIQNLCVGILGTLGLVMSNYPHFHPTKKYLGVWKNGRIRKIKTFTYQEKRFDSYVIALYQAAPLGTYFATRPICFGSSYFCVYFPTKIINGHLYFLRIPGNIIFNLQKRILRIAKTKDSDAVNIFANFLQNPFLRRNF